MLFAVMAIKILNCQTFTDDKLIMMKEESEHMYLSGKEAES